MQQTLLAPDGARIELRPIEPADEPFLCLLYATTRWDELAATGWADEEKLAFARQQFEAQHRYYVEHLAESSDFLLILRDGEPAGRLYLGRWEDEIRVIDVTLLPEHRNAGLGTRLMRDVQAEARASGVPVTLHVDRESPARRWYVRLGFELVEERGFNDFMAWRPSPAS
jgi:GNAT superfamily N-acetyltransferase